MGSSGRRGRGGLFEDCDTPSPLFVLWDPRSRGRDGNPVFPAGVETNTTHNFLDKLKRKGYKFQIGLNQPS